MSKEERVNQSVSQDSSDAAEAKPTGELSDQDLDKVDGGVGGLHLGAPGGGGDAGGVQFFGNHVVGGSKV